MVRYEDMVAHGMDDDDSEEEVGPGSGATTHKAKPRRKSHQRPQGSDQIRQAFSKRKKGLVLKAYQLSALTDAKVFMFIVNDKGTSWAYATPGFASSLNPELMRELRLLAQVPEHAKLITEVMPDPPNMRATDTAGTAVTEHPALRQSEQPGSYSLPCTRTATGALAARSRSSYSGGSAGEPPALMGQGLALGRCGSTTTQARLHSAAQSGEHSPTKPDARPRSGSSIAAGGTGARTSSTAGHGQLMQQYGGGRFGAGIEPPTPSGVYGLMGQPLPANGTCNESPTLLSEVAGSCGSPGYRGAPSSQQPLAAAAAGAGDMQLNEALLQQWQQQAMLPPGMQWIPQQGWELSMQQQDLSQQQQQQQEEQQQGGWMDGQQQQVAGAAANGYALGMAGAGCQQLAGMCGGGNIGQAAIDSAAAAAWQQEQQQMAAFAASNAGSSGHQNGGAFESLQRCLAPLRVSKRGRGAGAAAGPHSAPAGAVNTLLGVPSDWLDFQVRDAPLRVLSDAAAYGASSSGYSSYGPSPSAGPAAADGQQQLQGVAGVGCGAYVDGPTAAFVLPPDAGSADPSPTAALSSKMRSVLAMNSPMHPSSLQQQQQQQQQQQAAYCAGQGWDAAPDGRYGSQAQQQRGATPQALPEQKQELLYPQEAQQQQGQHNQGEFIPRTDDLMGDPLMDLLMEQAVQQRAGSQQGRPPRSQRGQGHVSIMDATLRQTPSPQHQQQQTPQQQFFGSGGGQQQAEQPASQQQQQLNGYVSIGGAHHSAAAAAAAASQPRQLVHVASMLDHLPLPRKNASEVERAAWAEQVKAMIDSLPSQQRSQFLAMVTEKMTGGGRGSNASAAGDAQASAAAAAPAANGFCMTSSNSCSPVLSSGANNSAGGGAGTAAAAAAAGGYTPRLGGGVALQGGKQRHGPSRLSATSPAMESAAQQQGFVPSSYGLVAPGLAMTGSGSDGLMAMPPPSAMAGEAGYYAVTAGVGAAGPCGYDCGPMMMQLPASANTTMATMCPPPQQQMVFGMPQAAGAAYSAPAAYGGGASGGGLLGGGGGSDGLLGEVLAADDGGGRATCSSPLKRSQPCSFGLLSAFGEGEVALSPLKRVCKDLPEPPSFATLMQTEDGEEDAVAWAASAAANGSMQGLPSCASLGRALGQLNSSGSLPAFIDVSGCEAVAAQMAEAAAAAEEAGAAAAGAQQQQQQQQQDADGGDAFSGAGAAADGSMH